MYKTMLEYNKRDKILMCVICLLDVIIAIFDICLIWQKNYFPAHEIFFLIYFSFFCGSKFIIHTLLIIGTFSKKHKIFDFKKMYLFIVFIAIEASMIIVNCFFYAFVVGNFFERGYLFLMFDLVMIAIFAHRYFFLRAIKKHFEKTAEQTTEESSEKITDNTEETA